MSFEERHSIIKQNVAFFAPQPSDSSTTEVDSVTSYQVLEQISQFFFFFCYKNKNSTIGSNGHEFDIAQERNCKDFL